MAYGKQKMLDCGHVGEAVVGQYYACPVCDTSDGVPRHIPEEWTKKLCPHCGSDDLQVYPGFTMGGKDLWHCHTCTRTHQRPAELDDDGA